MTFQVNLRRRSSGSKYRLCAGYSMIKVLIIHIIFGTLSLLAALGAILCAKGKYYHRLFGSVFYWSMLGIFITAIPLALLNHNIFLLVIALFSFYLAFSGRRFAKNRYANASLIDWFAVMILFFSGIAMLVLGVIDFTEDGQQYIILFVFSIISLTISYRDYKGHKDKSIVGKTRIAKHLTNMLAATIAVITAVIVTNFHFQPIL